jgi:hypothetical protein
LGRACAALRTAPPGHRDRVIGEVVYRVARLCAAGEADAAATLTAPLGAMASNSGTNRSHRDKVERCFNDGLRSPAEHGPIDDRHLEDDDFGDDDGHDAGDGGPDDHHHDGAGEHSTDASGQQQQSSQSLFTGGPQSAPWGPIDLSFLGVDIPPPALVDAALPAGWAEIIRNSAEAAAAPADYVALAAIVGAAGAAGNAYVIEASYGWHEPAVLWGAPIGPPGAKKTPSIRDPHDALIAMDRMLYARWKEDCEKLEVQYELACDAHEAAKRAKRAGKVPKKPEKPPLEQFVHDDATIEKVTLSMAQSPHGAVAFYSELGAWIGSFGRYSNSGDDAVARAFWNTSFDAGWHKRDRVGNEGPPVVVPRAACSVLGATQPDKLREYLRGADDGLMARLLFIWPRPLPPRPIDFDRDLHRGAAQAFKIAFRALYSLPLVIDPDGVPQPAVLRLAKEAQGPFSAANMDCETRARNDRGLVAQFRAKGGGRILRLALVYELMAWTQRRDDSPLPAEIGRDLPPPPAEVGLDAVGRAIPLRRSDAAPHAYRP